MKILLMSPPFKRFTGLINNYFPIGLAYLSAIAKQDGHQVKILQADNIVKPLSLDFTDEYRRYDLYIKGVNELTHPVWQEISEIIRNFKPDLVGINSMTPQIASALKVADLCKQLDPKCLVLVGGAHPTVSPDQTIKYPSVDFIIRGEGEVSFRELIKAINSNEKVLTGIKGLSFKKNGAVIHNPDSEFIKELDEIPFPSRDDLLNQSNYTSEDMGVVLTSRGCPFHCTYCYHPWKGKMSFRSIDNVMEEIRQVNRDYGTRQFAIKDDTFCAKRERVVEFCEKLLKSQIKINWDCTTRVDRIDEKLLKLMIKAGCNVIKVGIETGSERILEETHKGITMDQARQAAKLFNRFHVFWSGYFMMGLPQETEEEVLQTYTFMTELNPHYAGLGVYEPFRLTQLFDLGVQLGLLYPEVEIEHFYKTRPKDYYFRDPRKRSLHISPERFEELATFMSNAFEKHNTKFTSLMRRGWARRHAYMGDVGLLWDDCKKAFNWISSK